MKVSEAFDLFVKSKSRCRPRTIQLLEKALDVCDASDADTLDDISAATVMNWRAANVEKAVRTVALGEKALKQFVRWTCDMGIDKRAWNEHPLSRVRAEQDAGTHYRRALGIEECRALVTHSRPRLACLWKTYLCTLMRKSELLGLTWDCVDLKAGEIRLPAESTKMNTERFCLLGTRLKTMFAEFALEHGAVSLADHPQPSADQGRPPFRPEGPVFRSRSGTALKHNVNRKLNSSLKRCGIDPRGVDVHALRVTGATILDSLGAPLGVSETIIGHGRVKTGPLLLRKYNKPQREVLLPWVQKLEDAILCG